MMTRMLPAAVTLALFPLSLHAAADSAVAPSDFQAQLSGLAEPAGKAGATIACAGLAAALRIAAPDGSNAESQFRALEEELVFYAMMTRREDTGEAQDAALEGIIPFLKDISALYLSRFEQNKAASGELLDSAVRANFGFCEEMRNEMKAALEKR